MDRNRLSSNGNVESFITAFSESSLEENALSSPFSSLSLSFSRVTSVGEASVPREYGRDDDEVTGR